MNRNRLYLTSGVGVVLAVGLAASTAATETKQYSYDALGRLVIAKSTGTVNNNHTRSLCYDSAGNRVQFSGRSDGSALTCAPAPTPAPTPTPTPTPTDPTDPPYCVSKPWLCDPFLNADPSESVEEIRDEGVQQAD